jgi:hypothetical protein
MPLHGVGPQARPAHRPLRVHIGHHFYGAGNIGDDLMMGGFLAAVARCAAGRAVELTCASAFDLASQRRRFPQVEWVAYEPAVRERCVRACDVWLGLGDTPFQTAVGNWFYYHLAEELALCRRHGKPMYFLGVGVEHESAVVGNDLAAPILRAARHVWARDEQTARWLAAAAGERKVTAAADLAHAYLRGRVRLPAEAGVTGLVLNFEDPRRFNPAALLALVEHCPDRRAYRWLVQEVRALAGSETWTYRALSTPLRRRLEVRAPDYARGTLDGLLDAWGAPDTLITSRYHAAVAGAWWGARVVAVCRSGKVRGWVEQGGVTGLDAFGDVTEIRRAAAAARPVPPDRLAALADAAERSVEEFLRRA